MLFKRHSRKLIASIKALISLWQNKTACLPVARSEGDFYPYWVQFFDQEILENYGLDFAVDPSIVDRRLALWHARYFKEGSIFTKLMALKYRTGNLDNGFLVFDSEGDQIAFLLTFN